MLSLLVAVLLEEVPEAVQAEPAMLIEVPTLLCRLELWLLCRLELWLLCCLELWQGAVVVIILVIVLSSHKAMGREGRAKRAIAIITGIVL